MLYKKEDPFEDVSIPLRTGNIMTGGREREQPECESGVGWEKFVRIRYGGDRGESLSTKIMNGNCYCRGLGEDIRKSQRPTI